MSCEYQQAMTNMGLAPHTRQAYRPERKGRVFPPSWVPQLGHHAQRFTLIIIYQCVHCASMLVITTKKPRLIKNNHLIRSVLLSQIYHLQCHVTFNVAGKKVLILESNVMSRHMNHEKSYIWLTEVCCRDFTLDNDTYIWNQHLGTEPSIWTTASSSLTCWSISWQTCNSAKLV